MISAGAHLGGVVVFTDLGNAQTGVTLLGTGSPQSITLPELAVPAFIDGAVLALGTQTLWRWDAQAAPAVLHVFASLSASPFGLRMQLPSVPGLIFEADDGAHGDELWISDGTANGTHLFMDLTPGPASTLFDGFSFLVQGKAVTWMDAAGLNLGLEPWVTDGTVAGTLLLGDLAPGPAGSAPDYGFGATGPGSQRRMIGMISTPQYGAEPWVTDGTPGGTHLVADINPGPNPSMGMFGYHAMHVGPDPVFVANDGVHGYEPWVIQLEGRCSSGRRLFAGWPLLRGGSGARHTMAARVEPDPAHGCGPSLAAIEHADRRRRRLPPATRSLDERGARRDRAQRRGRVDRQLPLAFDDQPARCAPRVAGGVPVLGQPDRLRSRRRLVGHAGAVIPRPRCAGG